MKLGSQVVTVLRATATEDDYGNPVRDWTTAAVVEVRGCSLQPLTGAEVTIGRDTVVPRWRLWAPAGTDLLASDRVRYDGVAYEVDGEPQRWDFPPLSHVEALLRKAS